MLTPDLLHDYQKRATLHQLYHDDSMLWLDMGLGKTVITLSSIAHRMQVGQVQKTLIFGPLRVIYSVWEREARKWSHTQHLRFSIIHGTVKQREMALFKDADIYLCNYEAMGWLAAELDHYYISQDKPLPFQSVVYDEVTKVKNSQSQRIKGGWTEVIRKPSKLIGAAKGKTKKQLKAQGWDDHKLIELGMMIPAEKERVKTTGWRKVIDHFKYRTGLTGSPAPNGYMDLFGQYLAVDGGERLGEYITHYRDAYFVKGYDGWTYLPSEQGKQWIEHKIADMTLKMDAADYLELPEVIYNDVMVDMPEKAMVHYQEIEKEMFTRLDDGTEIELFNRASVSNKCAQAANGSPYKSPETSEWVNLHEVKLEALDDIIEESGGSPVLIAYSFKSDAERIMKRYKKLKPVNLTTTPSNQLRKTINDWIDGKIKVMIGHAASLGHGIDGLQESGNTLVWFGLNWSLELYLQMNARLDRQGQTKPVIIHRILCNDTIDLAISDALIRKTDDQDGLKDSIQRYRDGKASTIKTPCFL